MKSVIGYPKTVLIATIVSKAQGAEGVNLYFIADNPLPIGALVEYETMIGDYHNALFLKATRVVHQAESDVTMIELEPIHSDFINTQQELADFLVEAKEYGWLNEKEWGELD